MVVLLDTNTDWLQDTQEGSFGVVYIVTRSVKSKHLRMLSSFLFVKTLLT